jgi:hypothetical protein
LTSPDNLFLRDEAHRAAGDRGALPALNRTRGSMVFTYLAIICILTGCAGLMSAGPEIMEGAALKRSGQRIEASQLTRHKAGTTSQPKHRITYTYTSPDGRRHERTGSVTKDRWADFCEGCPIDARYVPDAPHISSLHHEPRLAIGLFEAAWTAVIGAIGLVIGGLVWRDRRKQRRLKRHGRLRLATLLDVTTREDKSLLWITLHYQLDGADTPRSLELLDDTLRDRLPTPGARLAFAYEADDNLELL